MTDNLTVVLPSLCITDSINEIVEKLQHTEVVSWFIEEKWNIGLNSAIDSGYNESYIFSTLIWLFSCPIKLKQINRNKMKLLFLYYHWILFNCCIINIKYSSLYLMYKKNYKNKNMYQIINSCILIVIVSSFCWFKKNFM